MKAFGLTPMEMLTLLVILLLTIVISVPYLEMAGNHAKMNETLKVAHSLAMALENYRLEVLTGHFVENVKQLEDLTTLDQKSTPWLVPEYVDAQKIVTAWGDHFLFEIDKEGQINMGVPGRSGKVAFSLTADPLFYDLLKAEDFDRGFVFRNGRMVIGPNVISGR